MKPIFVILFLFFLAKQGSAQEIVFKPYQDLKQHIEQANREKKPLFIFFTSDHCKPCPKMKKEVFADPQTADFYNRYFYNVVADAKDSLFIEAKRKFGIPSYPSLIYYNQNSSQFRVYSHEWTKEAFMKMGRESLRYAVVRDSLKQIFDKGNRDYHFTVKYIDYAQNVDQVNEIIDAYFNSIPVAEWTKDDNLVLLVGSLENAESKTAQYFEEKIKSNYDSAVYYIDLFLKINNIMGQGQKYLENNQFHKVMSNGYSYKRVLTKWAESYLLTHHKNALHEQKAWDIIERASFLTDPNSPIRKFIFANIPLLAQKYPNQISYVVSLSLDHDYWEEEDYRVFQRNKAIRFYYFRLIDSVAGKNIDETIEKNRMSMQDYAKFKMWDKYAVRAIEHYLANPFPIRPYNWLDALHNFVYYVDDPKYLSVFALIMSQNIDRKEFSDLYGYHKLALHYHYSLLLKKVGNEAGAEEAMKKMKVLAKDEFKLDDQKLSEILLEYAPRK